MYAMILLLGLAITTVVTLIATLNGRISPGRTLGILIAISMVSAVLARTGANLREITVVLGAWGLVFFNIAMVLAMSFIQLFEKKK